MTILLAITFILGPVNLVLEFISNTKLFDRAIEIPALMELIFRSGHDNQLLHRIDKLIFLLCMIFQAYHWIFQSAIVY